MARMTEAEFGIQWGGDHVRLEGYAGLQQEAARARAAEVELSAVIREMGLAMIRMLHQIGRARRTDPAVLLAVTILNAEMAPLLSRVDALGAK